LTPPDFRVELERLRLDARLRPGERLDWVRPLLDDGVERDLALEPFELEPLRDELERPPERPLRLDELRPLCELFFCPDAEVRWAILASLSVSVGWGCFADRSVLGERLADALNVVP
jgi:hypothetical protein